MGCISKVLTVPERWRSLTYQGVQYLYAPVGSPLRNFIDTAKSTQQSQPLVAKTAIPAKSVVVAQTPPVALKNSLPPLATHHPPEQKSSSPVSKKAQSLPRKTGLAEPDWPAPWLSFVEKVQAGRSLLWTYPEAGQDLSGKNDKQRSELIRKIITTLQLPAGSSNFWPHRSDPKNSNEEEKAYFLKGLDSLNPKFILVFGPEALADINPEAEFAKYTYTGFNGRLLLSLPSMDELYTSSDLELCLSFLSTFTKSLQRPG